MGLLFLIAKRMRQQSLLVERRAEIAQGAERSWPQTQSS
jgi:hypothetical protein